MNLYLKNAFTLLIIGIIAAITIPALVQNTNKQELATNAKVAMTIVSQVYDKAYYDNGSISYWGFVDGSDEGIEPALDLLIPYFNTIKVCRPNEAGCFPSKTFKLNGVARAESSCYGTNCAAFILANGMMVSLDVGGASTYGVNNPSGTCLAFIIDVNGTKKPNTLGRDIFYYTMTLESGVRAGGSDDESKCLDKSNGLNCTAKVIRENAINY